MIKINKSIKFLFLLIIFCLVPLFCCKKETSNITENTNINYEAEITKVIDGDTVEIKFCSKIPEYCQETERVRLIGVNTPELNLYKEAEPEYYAMEAYYYTKKYTGEKVLIELDNISELKDKYSRLLAYVWLCNYTMLNLNLIEDGYGYYYDYFNFNPDYMKQFCEAEKTAQREKKGMWK